jgi:hypothetical protein
MESWDMITTLSQVECVGYQIKMIKDFVISYNMNYTKSIDFDSDVWKIWMKNNIYIYIYIKENIAMLGNTFYI